MWSCLYDAIVLHKITQDRRFYLMVFVENDANNVLERMVK